MPRIILLIFSLYLQSHDAHKVPSNADASIPPSNRSSQEQHHHAVPHQHARSQSYSTDLAGSSGIQSVAQTMSISLLAWHGHPIAMHHTVETLHVYCSKAEKQRQGPELVRKMVAGPAGGSSA